MNYNQLPKDFLDKMQSLLGEAYGDYLSSFAELPFQGLRVNTLKVQPDIFAALSPWKLEPVPWISNGFYYKEEDKPAKHPYYYAGLYYLQEPSAMTPANLLPVEPGDNVLDLCAAPGGKSTELAAKLKGRGLLFSNDISNSRAKALLKNLELFGVENFVVSCETPDKLAQYFAGFFDKILVDAPCSGEGMFRRDSDMVKSYMEKGPGYYCSIQKEIIIEAAAMLKPGGLLLYSTCTFDEEENEGVIRYALKTCPELELLELEKKEGFAPGIGLTECVRLFPHTIKGEGHFAALLRKKGGGEQTGGLELKPPVNPSSPALKPVLEFLSQIRKDFDKDRIFIKNDSVYYLPKPLLEGDIKRLEKIRYLRTGLLLGELKKERFTPSQALAMCLKQEEFPNLLLLGSSDERTIRYLKGETLFLKEDEYTDEKGWRLVCADGFPLGWGKQMGGSLKNKYYPGWRWL